MATSRMLRLMPMSLPFVLSGCRRLYVAGLPEIPAARAAETCRRQLQRGASSELEPLDRRDLAHADDRDRPRDRRVRLEQHELKRSLPRRRAVRKRTWSAALSMNTTRFRSSTRRRVGRGGDASSRSSTSRAFVRSSSPARSTTTRPESPVSRRVSSNGVTPPPSTLLERRQRRLSHSRRVACVRASRDPFAGARIRGTRDHRLALSQRRSCRGLRPVAARVPREHAGVRLWGRDARRIRSGRGSPRERHGAPRRPRRRGPARRGRTRGPARAT